ncbi:hypothetical protein IAQ61_005725 [Plenodomus lingam]|uniref:uncharacterized protein n=1 Tax=Leptosphaeria maculans TaxID=5022 RepID=UPI0033332223|nr:hypothetical protein IAQ61_005725 [Plenodomus lingam]
MFISAILILSLALLCLGDMHQYCACQRIRAGPIHTTATLAIAKQCNNKFVLAQSNDHTWVKHTPGPNWPGIYLSLKSKAIEIDGDYFHSLCISAGAAASTCFNCKNAPQISEFGGIMCWS